MVDEDCEATHAADEDVAILYRAPESFDHEVIQSATCAIHADAYFMVLQRPGNRAARILAPLDRC